jgi:hypothetical protein
LNRWLNKSGIGAVVPAKLADGLRNDVATVAMTLLSDTLTGGPDEPLEVTGDRPRVHHRVVTELVYYPETW